MGRIGITRLVTKQSTSSSSLRHVSDCSVEGKESGEGKWEVLIMLPLCKMGMCMDAITYGQRMEILCVHSTYVCIYIHPQAGAEEG